jgi:ribose-phosphate pyrophosphokinase
MKLFGLNESGAFAERLAQHLDVAVAAHEERNFADGEFKVRALDSVRGEHAVVCQSLAADARSSSADKLLRMLVFCGALKDAGAERVTAVVPYLAYWRKDRRTQPRDPVTTSYVARLIEAVGIDAVVTLDVHDTGTFDNAFRCRKDNVEGAAAFAEHYTPLAAAAKRVVVLSPDAGGGRRARTFAALLAARTQSDVELAFMEKRRSGGLVSGSLFAGDVRDALVIVYDDMISTGGTVARAAQAAAARGAAAVHCAATHALLVGDAVAALNAAPLASLAVMDTVPDAAQRCAGLRCEWRVLDCAAVVAAAFSEWRAARGLVRPDRAFDVD